MSKTSNSHFWKIRRGELSPPPILQNLGFHVVDADPTQGLLTTGFAVDDRFNDFTGHVQGGILSAMLDGTLGPATGMMLGDSEFSPTLDLCVQFIAPAKPGRFIGKGKLTHKTDKICFAQGELYDEAGDLVATASATEIIRRLV